MIIHTWYNICSTWFLDTIATEHTAQFYFNAFMHSGREYFIDT